MSSAIFLEKLKKKTEEAAKKGLEVGEKTARKGKEFGEERGQENQGAMESLFLLFLFLLFERTSKRGNAPLFRGVFQVPIRTQ